MDRVMLYDIMYALAARDGREAALFVKLRWRDGSPLDAKAYFMAGLQE